MKYTIIPEWRSCKEHIVIYENLTLLDIQNDKSFVHTEESRLLVRFCVTDSGRLLVGDAWSVMHKDICHAFQVIDDYTALLAGVAILNSDSSMWEVRLQGFTSRKPGELLSRLTTWTEFTHNVQWTIAPYGITDI